MDILGGTYGKPIQIIDRPERCIENNSDSYNKVRHFSDFKWRDANKEIRKWLSGELAGGFQTYKLLKFGACKPYLQLTFDNI